MCVVALEAGVRCNCRSTNPINHTRDPEVIRACVCKQKIRSAQQWAELGVRWLSGCE